MSSKNFDLYSEYYNLFYADKDYKNESGFIHELINNHGKGSNHILELGCGTGGHAEFLASFGYGIHGIDQSEKMLEKARHRIKNLNKDFSNKVIFSNADLKEFKLNNKFDVVVSLFDVMSYITENDDLKLVFSNVRRSLKKNGLLIFDCWYGPGVYIQEPKIRIKRLENNDVSILRISEPNFLYRKNIVVVNYEIYIRNKSDDITSCIKECHPMRCFFEDELNELLGQFGFVPIFLTEWFNKAPVSEKSWSVLFGYQLIS